MDDGCEAILSVVGVADTDVVAIGTKGAVEEGVETAADGTLFDGAADVAAVDFVVAEAELGVTPVPSGTFARCCRAMSMWLAALTLCSKVMKSSRRGIAMSLSITFYLAQKQMVRKVVCGRSKI